MAKHWTKLRRDIVNSERMAALLEADPLAYALYINAKAVCDDYGRLEASPRKFRGHVAPMAELRLSKVEKALEVMEQVRVIKRYEVNGDAYLEIAEYNAIEGTDWKNVGRPDYPAPPWWTPPQGLLDYLATTTDPRATPERYGLNIARPSPDDRPTVARPSAERRHAREADTESEAKEERKNDDDSAAAPALDMRERGLALYCSTKRTTDSDPAAEQEFDNVAASYGVEATYQAAIVTHAKFAGEAEAPRGSAVASYLLKAARSTREAIEASGADAALAAYIAEHGRCPPDPFQSAVWEAELAKFREQHVQPA